MNYKKEIKKIGWSTKEVANRLDSLIEEKAIDAKDVINEDMEKIIKKGEDSAILNEFLNNNKPT